MDKRRVSKIYNILSYAYPTFDQSDDEWMTNGLSSTPFRSLVSAALSTMTSSARCIRACVALYKRVSTFEELLALDDDELKAIIKPVAHYNRKTKNVKTMCREIIERHGGKIPNNREDLLALTGIGQKCANLIMTFLFDEPTVAVDTHVHRLVNRLGMVETKKAEETAEVLTGITPEEYRRHAHEWLIQHGMNVCVARTPRCEKCPLTKQCDYFREHRGEKRKLKAAPAKAA